jgi:hypothetical protein
LTAGRAGKWKAFAINVEMTARDRGRDHDEVLATTTAIAVATENEAG